MLTSSHFVVPLTQNYKYLCWAMDNGNGVSNFVGPFCTPYGYSRSSTFTMSYKIFYIKDSIKYSRLTSIRNCRVSCGM